MLQFLQTIDGFVWLIVFAINKLVYLKLNQLENITLSDFKEILWCRGKRRKSGRKIGKQRLTKEGKNGTRRGEL